LEGIGPGVFGQPIVGRRRELDEPRVTGVPEFPFRNRHDDFESQAADGVFADHNGGTDFLDLVAFGRVEPDPLHFAPKGCRAAATTHKAFRQLDESGPCLACAKFCSLVLR